MSIAKRAVDLHIRVRRVQLANWKKAAKRSGQTLTAWVETLCDIAAVPPSPVIPPAVSGDQVELPLNGKRKGAAS